MKKITIEIADGLYDEIKETIHWGHRRHAVAAVLRLIVDAVKRDGHMVLGAIEDGEFKLVPARRDR